MFNPIMLLAVEEKTGIAVLGLDIKALLLQAGVFLLLFFIINKFAMRKIVDTLEDRRKTIDKGVTLGIEMQSAKEKFDEELKKMQHQARLKADDILAEAQQEAKAIIQEGEAAAAKKAEAMLVDAEAHIKQELSTARQSLRREMLELVSEATATIIDEKLDAKKDASLIERAISKVSGKARA
jgi:F-type H+-transporting ATPase subunit b